MANEPPPRPVALARGAGSLLDLAAKRGGSPTAPAGACGPICLNRLVAALYRTYRPQTFADVVGQEAVVRTLTNAIEQDKVRRASLSAAPRGTGKTSLARILAKAVNCEHGPTPTPDNTCHACVAIANG